MAAARCPRPGIAVIGELAGRLEGSGRQRCKTVAALLGVSEPYCRQLYKVSRTFGHKTLAATTVKPSTVIAAASWPQPERWLRRAEAEKLTELAVWHGTRAEKRGGQATLVTVYARCTCGREGWMQRLSAPVALTS